MAEPSNNMSKNKRNKKPTVATLSTNKKSNHVQKNQALNNKGRALKNISKATLVIYHKKVLSTKDKNAPFVKNQKEAPSTVKNEQEPLPTYISTKDQKPLTESQKILAIVQKILSTSKKQKLHSKARLN